MNYIEIEAILEELYEKINEQTIIVDTVYESVEELEDDILNYVEEMKDNSGQWLDLLDMHFQKDGTIQILDANNSWNLYTSWKERYIAARK